ncbi:AraC family transcriptional regulator [Chitinophaga alhagiae]|uniref:AraC family transcriptional regulator n=1 Tax=Chitinophaga alhagiae TaxID=2203219 RepID=A0ABM6W8R6_9BACT|nr:AraC family transcriptional regulator [Chitinophaga alhagiae]AWO00333.1 AraC family transcriptional regulator [Chitinophaga alhagiae]
MKAIEVRFAKEIDKSFVVFRETGKYFPCPWHYHPEYEFVLVTKSHGRRMVGDHIGYFDEGDLVLMGPNLPHVWVNDESFINGGAAYDADAIVIHFQENFLGKEFINIPEMETLKKILDLSRRGLVIQGSAREKIGKLMVKMMTMNGLQRLAALMSIFDLLSQSQELELLASPGYTPRQEDQLKGPTDRINEYIMLNFHREISLQEIAGVSNMAVTTFCNFFKNQYRCTFIEYLNQVRIGLACKLLANEQNKIVQVAYEVGFNNLGNFNRQFKKIKNMTPREYRKRLDTQLEEDSIFFNEAYIVNE